MSKTKLSSPKIIARDYKGKPLRSFVDIKSQKDQGLEVNPPLNPKMGNLDEPKFLDPSFSPRKRKKRFKMKKVVKSPQSTSLISWPKTSSGSLVGGPWPSPPLDAPSPESLGSLDWWAQASLGGSSAFLLLLESLLSGQGHKASKDWVQFARLYREWERLYSEGSLTSAPTLNQVSHALGTSDSSLISYLQFGISSLSLAQAQVRLAMALPSVVAASAASAANIESGFQDRKLLMEASGLLTKSGPSVVINNSNNQTIAPAAVAPQALQNLADMIDSQIRDVEGEVLEGDFQDV